MMMNTDLRRPGVPLFAGGGAGHALGAHRGSSQETEPGSLPEALREHDALRQQFIKQSEQVACTLHAASVQGEIIARQMAVAPPPPRGLQTMATNNRALAAEARALAAEARVQAAEARAAAAEERAVAAEARAAASEASAIDALQQRDAAVAAAEAGRVARLAAEAYAAEQKQLAGHWHHDAAYRDGQLTQLRVQLTQLQVQLSQAVENEMAAGENLEDITQRFGALQRRCAKLERLLKQRPQAGDTARPRAAMLSCAPAGSNAQTHAPHVGSPATTAALGVPALVCDDALSLPSTERARLHSINCDPAETVDSVARSRESSIASAHISREPADTASTARRVPSPLSSVLVPRPPHLPSPLWSQAL